MVKNCSSFFFIVSIFGLIQYIDKGYTHKDNYSRYYKYCYHFHLPISLRNSFLAFISSLKTPFIAEVVVIAPCFFIPRILMQV